jgi:hypothetical protein
MTRTPSPASRRPFVQHHCFLETAFAQRFQDVIRRAWLRRSWHVIAAVPGSGKSFGIHDLVLQSGAQKDATTATRLPVLAIRAPKNGATEFALGTALSAAFGVVPFMPWYMRRIWLVQAAATAQVECILIDDAQDLALAHLAFLKELTDNLAAPPYQRPVGLCLVVAHTSGSMPFKEVFARPDTLWRQFRRRLDTELPFCQILGHTVHEVRDILATFETIYRSQLPNLQLRRWATSITAWLTHPTLDPDGTGRVTMDHVTRFVVSVVRQAYEHGAIDVDATLLERTAELMVLRRDEVVAIDARHVQEESVRVTEVG